MPLGTLDRTPPPFFRQGPSALTKLFFFSALALFLMVADTRFKLAEPVRATMATALLPVQRALAVPVGLAERSSDYLQGLDSSLSKVRDTEARLVRQAERNARMDQIQAENQRLRGLLDLRPAVSVRSRAAEVLFEAADPFSRKVVIDTGAAQGIALGSPVINEAGVIGQVTRVYPLTSEVTLLTDRDAAIPVLNSRTSQRSAAFGGAAGGTAMELRFMSGNADVQPGDALVTSGLDGIYPPGLAVATVSSVDRRVDSGFARVVLKPAASADAVRHVLVLEPVAAQLPPRPAPPEPEKPVKGSRAGRP
jgi:rod shape-determining protein MreC